MRQELENENVVRKQIEVISYSESQENLTSADKGNKLLNLMYIKISFLKIYITVINYNY